MQEMQVQSLVDKIPWRRKWQPTPAFLFLTLLHSSIHSIDRGTWQATVHGDAKSKTWLGTHTVFFIDFFLVVCCDFGVFVRRGELKVILIHHLSPVPSSVTSIWYLLNSFYLLLKFSLCSCFSWVLSASLWPLLWTLYRVRYLPPFH